MPGVAVGISIAFKRIAKSIATHVLGNDLCLYKLPLDLHVAELDVAEPDVFEQGETICPVEVPLGDPGDEYYQSGTCYYQLPLGQHVAEIDVAEPDVFEQGDVICPT